PAAPRRGPSLTLFAVAGLVIALVAGAVGAVVATATDNGDDKSISLGNPKSSEGGDMPARDPGSVAGIAQKVLPSVVTVKLQLGEGGGTGSGFIVDQGYVITNNHVVSQAGSAGAELSVEFSDDSTAPATVVGTSPADDVAVLKLTTNHALPPLPLGDSSKLAVGDQVIAIGSPLGLEGSVTSGIISARDRVVGTSGSNGSDAAAITAIQTDAAINPGNSGGPLVEVSSGAVIGMNTAIASLNQGGSESGNIGLGFAIPINKVQEVAEQIVNKKPVTHAIIGIKMDTSQMSDDGVKIMSGAGGGVTPNGPADKAGLKGGDTILSLDGKKIGSPTDLVALIRSHKPGDKVKITYRRGGEEKTVDVTLGSGS
ncbi:S1C family serine protease, partial [Actinocorallia lasiicapitis]